MRKCTEVRSLKFEVPPNFNFVLHLSTFGLFVVVQQADHS